MLGLSKLFQAAKYVLWVASVTLAILHPRVGAAQGNPTHLKVMTFPGVSALTALTTLHKGFFEKNDLKVEVLLTPDSTSQREGLARGDLQIIHTSADNSIAMVESGKVSSVIVMGGDDAFNRIMVQPEISSLANLRGKTVAVDAPNTAFALLLYRSLREAGLQQDDYKVRSVGGTLQRMQAMIADKSNAASVLGPPFSLQGEDAGLKSLAAVRTYHSASVVTLRTWASANEQTLVRYLRALVQGRRWLLDPANKTEATKLVGEQLKLSSDLAARTYALIAAPQGGIEVDSRFDAQGFRNLLNLRAEVFDTWKGSPPPPTEKYVDLSYYEKAMSGL